MGRRTSTGHVGSGGELTDGASPYIQVRRFESAGAFLERAGSWLVLREAEHNLILGIAASLVTDPLRYETPVYFATVELDGEVAGCAYRTPPHKLGVTRMPLAAAPLLVDDLLEVYETLPAVLGPVDEAEAVGRAWADRTGVVCRRGLRQRIYQLDRVRPLARRPSGPMRRATEADDPVIVDWLARFLDQTGLPTHSGTEALASQLRASGTLHLWEDGGPVSMAAYPARTPRGARVSYVFTPESRRGRGYASALVAAMSQMLLDRGLRHCFLYTDISNTTSNRIYQSIGYEPVVDVTDIDFHGR